MSSSQELEGVSLLDIETFADHRGSLSRAYEAARIDGCDFDTTWRQAFVSRTEHRNTVRGLHYQFGDGAEAKLITPLSGELFWVSIDLREGSLTFGESVTVVLSRENGHALLVAPRFAHGCLSLTNDAEVFILSNINSAAEFAGGIHWNDPQLAIDWPALGGDPIISEDHASYPGFDQFIATRGHL